VAPSHAFGSIRDGVFDGKIITPQETFYIERAHKYTLPSTNQSLHSVIYTSRDVHDPYHHLRSGKFHKLGSRKMYGWNLINLLFLGHAKGCGITDEVMEWMQEIQNSAVEDMPELKHPKSKPVQKEFGGDIPRADRLRSNEIFYMDQDDHSYSMYSKEANLKFNKSNPSSSSSRGRRAARSNTQNSRTTCTLSIQTDPLLWKHIAEQVKITAD
jgi:disintegrin and metalloproteinase domain-containing protein 10